MFKIQNSYFFTKLKSISKIINLMKIQQEIQIKNTKKKNKRIASSGASLPKGDRGRLREEPCRAWNSFGNNIEEYATTNEMDFMGSITMSPTSGRQI